MPSSTSVAARPRVEEAGLSYQLSPAIEGVGEERPAGGGHAARAQRREHPAEERSEEGDLDQLPPRPLCLARSIASS